MVGPTAYEDRRIRPMLCNLKRAMQCGKWFSLGAVSYGIVAVDGRDEDVVSIRGVRCRQYWWRVDIHLRRRRQVAKRQLQGLKKRHGMNLALGGGAFHIRRPIFAPRNRRLPGHSAAYPGSACPFPAQWRGTAERKSAQ